MPRGQAAVTAALPCEEARCRKRRREGFDYWQQTPDTRLVLGGRRDKSLDLEFTSEEAVTDQIQDELTGFAAELLGDAPTVAHRWAGIFGATKDDLPLVGPVPGREGVWVAAGYSGHGNVLGLACGDLVGEAVLGRRKPERDLFDPGRFLA